MPDSSPEESPERRMAGMMCKLNLSLKKKSNVPVVRKQAD